MTRDEAGALFAPPELKAQDEGPFDVPLPLGRMRAGVSRFPRPPSGGGAARRRRRARRAPTPEAAGSGDGLSAAPGGAVRRQGLCTRSVSSGGTVRGGTAG